MLNRYQKRVGKWITACFGGKIGMDRVERGERFYEEATELVQACHMPKKNAHAIVEYVYARPIGARSQEVGGVMNTLAALCNAFRVSLDHAARSEMDRVEQPEIMAKIKAKQAAKPKGSALAEAFSYTPEPTVAQTIILVKAALTNQCDSRGVSMFDHALRVYGRAGVLSVDHGMGKDEVDEVGRIALLHDVIEDTDLELADLKTAGYSDTVVTSVGLLTHDTEAMTYSEYIERICESGDVYALIAKIADNGDNTDEARYVDLEPKYEAKLRARYAGVRPKLEQALRETLDVAA